MYSTYIQRIEIALLSDPWCIQLTLNTDSRRSNTDKYSLTICTYKLYRYTNEALRHLDETNMYKNIATYKTKNTILSGEREAAAFLTHILIAP